MVATGSVVVLATVVADGPLVVDVTAATETPPPPPHAVKASPAITADQVIKEKLERIPNYCIERL